MFFPSHLFVEDHPKKLGGVGRFDSLAVYNNLPLSVGCFPPGKMYQLSLFSGEGCARLPCPSFNSGNVFFLGLLDILLCCSARSLAEIVVNKADAPPLLSTG